MCFGDCDSQLSRWQLLQVPGPTTLGYTQVRELSQGFSLNLRGITFNYKFNVNECNQVIGMCEVYYL